MPPDRREALLATYAQRASGTAGRTRPEQLKVTVGFDGGFLAEAGISYAGPNAARRGRLANSRRR